MGQVTGGPALSAARSASSLDALFARASFGPGEVGFGRIGGLDTGTQVSRVVSKQARSHTPKRTHRPCPAPYRATIASHSVPRSVLLSLAVARARSVPSSVHTPSLLTRDGGGGPWAALALPPPGGGGPDPAGAGVDVDGAGVCDGAGGCPWGGPFGGWAA